MNKENRHHDETRVRRRLEGSLKGRFLDAHWRHLQPVVREYFNDLLTWEELKGLAQDSLELQRASERELLEKHGILEEPKDVAPDDEYDDSKSESFQPVFDIELPEREQKRAAVLLEIQIRQATKHPGVERFRRERLGERLLFTDEAETYFTSRPRETIPDRELADLGRRLKKDYGWHRDDAAWFVLTGEPPTLRPLAADFFTYESVYGPWYSELTLHVVPWVPAEEVKKTYERMRDQVRGGSGPGTVGGKRLELLRFVEEERAKRGRWISGPALLEMWNREYPRWSYGDYPALLKAYREARQEVLYPKYHTPERAETPNMVRQESRRSAWLEAVKEREARRQGAAPGTPRP